MIDQKSEETILKLAEGLKGEFEGEGTGHDWYHLERVWKLSKHICSSEGGDLFVVELTALLHDIADHKFVANANAVVEDRIQQILEALTVEQPVIDQVKDNVKNSSFKSSLDGERELSIECKIVQDADRLEAIGAIGIARTFAYGGSVANPIYDPKVPPTDFKSSKEYLSKRTHTINHFYEKLLNLKDRMNTERGKELASQRHDFMKAYLDQFYSEWELRDLPES